MKRQVYYDILRVTAILLVLMNHLPAYRLYMFQHGVSELGCLLLSVITRINVPLFAMLSGALLLGREESYGEIWRKRLRKMLLVTITCSVLLYLEFGWLRSRDLSWHELLYGLLAGNIRNFDSYWFLYAYIGFLIFLPFYRHVAQLMTKNDFYLLLSVHFLLSTLIPLSNIMLHLYGMPPLSVSPSLDATLSRSPLIFYPLLGYYVDKHIDVMGFTRRDWSSLAYVVIIGLTTTCTAVYIDGHLGKFSQNYLNLFTFVLVIAFFLCIKRLTIRYSTEGVSPSTEGIPTSIKGSDPSVETNAQPMSETSPVEPWWVKVFAFISPLVFGVYLLDNHFKLMAYEPLKAWTKPTLGYFWFSVLCCLCSFICCGLVTFIWREGVRLILQQMTIRK